MPRAEPGTPRHPQATGRIRQSRRLALGAPKTSSGDYPKTMASPPARNAPHDRFRCRGSCSLKGCCCTYGNRGLFGKSPASCCQKQWQGWGEQVPLPRRNFAAAPFPQCQSLLPRDPLDWLLTPRRAPDKCLVPASPIANPLNTHYTYPMAITQTVEIPPDRRITLEVPREVPTGSVVLTFTPAGTAKKAAMTENEERELFRLHADELNREALDVLSYQDLEQ